MSLSDIILGVVSEFNSGRSPVIPTFIGEKFVRANATPPRLVWVPTTDTFGPAEHEGTNPRPLGVRRAGCSLYVQGTSLAITEGLLNDVIAAIHRTVSRKNYVIEDAEWLTPGELTSNGYECRVDLTLTMPVTDKAYTVASPISRVSGVISGPTESEAVETEALNAFSLVSGDGQTGIHSEPLADPVVLLVTGPNGPVQGAKVVFTQTTRGLVPDAAFAYTGADGKVSMGLTMSDSLVVQTLLAEWMLGDGTLETSIQISATPVG